MYALCVLLVSKIIDAGNSEPLILHERSSSEVFFVRNLGLLHFHALNLIGCMKIYHKLSKSIVEKTRYSKTNIKTIENIDLELKCSYLVLDVLRSICCGEKHA